MGSVWAKLSGVTGAELSLLDHLGSDNFALIGPANVSKEVDEKLCDVELVAELAGCVIPRESVVVVVETLAKSGDGHSAVLRRVDVLVVGSAAPHVSSRVD